MAHPHNKQMQRARTNRLSKPVTVSGKLGDDAKQYQIRAVRNAIAELQQ